MDGSCAQGPRPRPAGAFASARRRVRAAPAADVLDREGRKLGSVDRLVVDPTAHRITHIVVDGRLIGIGRVADAGPERLRVDLTHDALARLPEAHPRLVVPPGEQWRPPTGYVL